VEPDSRSIADGIDEALASDGTVEYEDRSWATVADEHVEFYGRVLAGE
jgi:hypothetical protein